MGILQLVAAVQLLCFSHAFALYSPSSPVTGLDSSNFASKLKNGVWMVEFYAPWEKAAKGLKGIVNVGAVDADADRQLAGEHGVSGFPTIKLMYHDGTKIKSVDYNSGRTAKDIINFAMDKAKSLAFKRIGQKSGSSSSGSGGGSGGGFYPSSSGVINLSQGNFESQVLGGSDLWMVEFYAPWCGHCQKLKPEYIEAAQQVAGKVKLGAVNCDEEKSLCGDYGIQGFPTLKWFGKNKQRPQDYPGDRDAASLQEFSLAQWAKNAPAPEVMELVSQDVFNKHCVGETDADAKQLCIIAFLPSILDSKASGRNAYIKTLKTIANKYKERPYGYFWAEGGAQAGLEQNVGVGGFGFVAHKGALEVPQMSELIDGIRTGGRGGVPLVGALAQPETLTPWDGQDGKIEEVEEFSLDDIMGEEF